MLSFMKAIHIITTGGTIGSRVDPVTGGAVPAVSAQELIAMAPRLREIAAIHATEFGRLQSWNIGPAVMVQLAAAIRDALDQPDALGAVVTHGTDTMEETAFAIDLLVRSSKPVVFTGAMRNASDPRFEGPANLWSSALVVSSAEAAGRGAMVVMNRKVHAAAFVTKMHTTSLYTFASPEVGPLGYVEEAGVTFERSFARLPGPQWGTREVNVQLIKVAAGMDSLLLDAALRANVDGVVLEASGAGNVPDAWSHAIAELIRRGVPVVLVSRCLTGRIDPAYGGAGGGRTLRELGVIDGSWLSGPKARVALALCLMSGTDIGAIRDYFAALRETTRGVIE